MRPAHRTLDARLGAALVALAAAGCNTPRPSLHIVPAGPPSQACPSTDCGQVALRCSSVVSIRIFDPKHPTEPLLDQCTPLSPNASKDLCAVAQVDLEPVPLPVTDLEVQVALFPTALAGIDPITDRYVCPRVAFSSSGLPIEQSPAPALGGRAYYHPGDSTVEVMVGCTSLASINDSCDDPTATHVSVTATDFLQPRDRVSRYADAEVLLVSAGEPRRGEDNGFVFNPTDRTPLGLDTEEMTIPTWRGTLAHRFSQYACVDVLENRVRSTATLHCELPAAASSPVLTGLWLKDTDLTDVLRAIGEDTLPEAGITIGIVVDELLNPVAGAQVTAQSGTVRYLSKGRTGIVSGGTSDSGVFVSLDAEFGTRFSASTSEMAGEGFGGNVAQRVTAVLIELRESPAARTGVVGPSPGPSVGSSVGPSPGSAPVPRGSAGRAP